jgi:putative endonuclease
MKKGHLLGKTAENYAALFFQRKGYCILAQNYRFRKAEIDLIVQKNDTIVCVEVKARSYDYYGHPSIFIHKRKQKLLCMAMDHFAQNTPYEAEFRFDILCVYKSHNKWQVEHLKNAFYCMD